MVSITLLGWILLAQQAPPPKPCTAIEYRQFDFWIGDWEVRGPKGNVAGTNRIEPIEGGCALLESWRAARTTSYLLPPISFRNADGVVP